MSGKRWGQKGKRWCEWKGRAEEVVEEVEAVEEKAVEEKAEEGILAEKVEAVEAEEGILAEKDAEPMAF